MVVVIFIEIALHKKVSFKFAYINLSDFEVDYDFEGNERLCGKQQSGPKNHKQLRLLDSRGKVG